MIVEEGQKQFTATVFVVSETKPRKFLLAHHKKLDKWLPPGGHIEKMENPIEAAIREVKEESGVDIVPFLDKVQVIDDRANSIPLPILVLEERIDAYGDQPEHYHLDFIYVVEVPLQDIKYAERESHDIAWFTVEEMKNLPIFDNTHHEIDIVLKKING